MPIVIGYKARELLYFGDTIDARAALELGMVNGSCKLGKASLRRASTAADLGEALNAAKRAINCGPDAAGFRTALYAGARRRRAALRDLDRIRQAGVHRPARKNHASLRTVRNGPATAMRCARPWRPIVPAYSGSIRGLTQQRGAV